MVKEIMLSKEERQWLKVSGSRLRIGAHGGLTGIKQDHNRQCLERLEPYLREDKRAMKYLRREAERGIGIASAGPGALTIDWD